MSLLSLVPKFVSGGAQPTARSWHTAAPPLKYFAWPGDAERWAANRRPPSRGLGTWCPFVEDGRRIFLKAIIPREGKDIISVNDEATRDDLTRFIKVERRSRERRNPCVRAVRQPSVVDEIQRRTGRTVAPAAVYITLRRLEQKGLLTSWMGDSTPERGGKSRRCVKVTEAGLEGLRASSKVLDSMWTGLDAKLRGAQ
jgi:DNA-binding MarR family transcriptional regulator